MYKEIHIEYTNPYTNIEPLVLKYKIRTTNIAQKWANKVATCIEKYNIDQPDRFYGFDDFNIEKFNAIQSSRHIVTWLDMDRDDTLELEDYNHFSDYYEHGTIYLLYVEIGKTLEDLATDNDRHMDDTYKPFRHYTADFIVRFFGTHRDTWKKNRMRIKSYYESNKKFFDSRGLPLSHPYNRPGNIPLADIIPRPFDLVTEIKKRQFVSKVALI